MSGKVLDFTRGKVLEPVPGTICYERGQAIGVWGKDVPLRWLWWPDGAPCPRPMTRAEERFARRMMRR